MNTHRGAAIGIVGGEFLDEPALGSGDFSVMANWLALERRPIATLGRPITRESLDGVEALALAEFIEPLSPDELLTVRAWTMAGGHLLLLGDATAKGEFSGEVRGKLSGIVPGIEFAGLIDAKVPAHTPDENPLVVTAKPSLFREMPLRQWPGDSIQLIIEHAHAIFTHGAPVVVRQAWPVPGNCRIHGARRTGARLFVEAAWQSGRVLAMGAANWLRNDALGEADHLRFFEWLVARWLPDIHERERDRRMQWPQRHRLLHGYPMAPVMANVAAPSASDEAKSTAQSLANQMGLGRLFGTMEKKQGEEKRLLLGVLPHPFCNPAVKGCGFCTFPHEAFTRDRAARIAALVRDEIENFSDDFRDDFGASDGIEAIYFGGATANLTPPAEFRRICAALTTAFPRAETAEVTLEGAPIFFAKGAGPELLDAMGDFFAGGSRRISMGIQTFDEARLAQMGRTAFGNRATFAEVVKLAHARGLTVSGDLLVNLPGQSLAEMQADVRAAIDIGLDHICVYHLVLADGMGTEWSRDAGLLASLPGNATAVANWESLREMLLSAGFVQTTLTNFERRDHQGTPRAFRYELAGFSPQNFDMVGVGPGAISGVTAFEREFALKVINAESAAEYEQAMLAATRAGSERPRMPWRKWFAFGPRDMRILFLTRQIARLRVNRREYRQLFGTDVLAEFGEEFAVCERVGLVTISPTHIELTARGMFFADTIAGLIAWRQIRAIDYHQRLHDFAPATHATFHRHTLDINDAIDFGMG